MPWICAAVGSLLISAYADRTRDYRTCIAGSILTAAFFLAVSVLAGPARPVLAIGALSLCLGFMYCYAVYWAALTAFVATDVLAVAMGGINAIGNLGGFVGPFIVGLLISRTGTPAVGQGFLIACLLVSGLFALRLRNRTVPIAPLAVASAAGTAT